MAMKKIISILLSALLSAFLVATPSWAINVSPGDHVELQATSSLGVPLHRTSSSSLSGRAPDGTIAEVVGTANNKHWVEIELPDGNQKMDCRAIYQPCNFLTLRRIGRSHIPGVWR